MEAARRGRREPGCIHIESVRIRSVSGIGLASLP